MSELTAEWFERPAGKTCTLFALDGITDDGTGCSYAEISITLTTVKFDAPTRYPTAVELEESGGVMMKPVARSDAETGRPAVPEMPTPFRHIFHAPDHRPLTNGGYTISHPEPGTIEHLHLCCEAVAVYGKCACIDRGAEVRMAVKRLDHECCVLPATFG